MPPTVLTRVYGRLNPFMIPTRRARSATKKSARVWLRRRVRRIPAIGTDTAAK